MADEGLGRDLEPIPTEPELTTTPGTARRAARNRRRLRLVVVGAAAAVACAAAVAAISYVARTERGERTTTLTFDSQRDWLVAAYNAEEPPPDSEIEARFADGFLIETPPETVRETLAVGGRFGTGWSVLRELDRNDTALATQLVAETGEQTQLAFALDEDGRIKGLAPLLRALPCEVVHPAEVSVAPELLRRLRWYLGLVNRDAPVSREELAEAFTPEVLEATPEDEFEPGLERLRAGDAVPFRVRYYEGEPSAFSLTARIGTNGYREGALKLVIESRDPWRIAHASVTSQLPCILPAS